MALKPGTYDVGSEVILTCMEQLNSPFIIKKICKSNPLQGTQYACIGTISEVIVHDLTATIKVKWKNGTTNWYGPRNLTLLLEKLQFHPNLNKQELFNKKDDPVFPPYEFDESFIKFVKRSVDNFKDKVKSDTDIEKWTNPLKSLRGVLADVYGREEHAIYMHNQAFKKSEVAEDQKTFLHDQVANIMGPLHGDCHGPDRFRNGNED